MTNAITKEEIELFRKVKKICRAADHKLRKDILDYFLKNKESTVTEMFVHLRIEQAVASQNLKILRDANLVTARRDGRNIYYSVNTKRISQYTETMKSLFS